MFKVSKLYVNKNRLYIIIIFGLLFKLLFVLLFLHIVCIFSKMKKYFLDTLDELHLHIFMFHIK